MASYHRSHQITGNILGVNNRYIVAFDGAFSRRIVLIVQFDSTTLPILGTRFRLTHTHIHTVSYD